MNMKKLSLGIAAVALIAVASIYLAKQSGVFNAAAGNAPEVAAKTDTTSDVSAGLGQSNGPLAKLKQLGQSVKDTVSDVLDKPLISKRVETLELEANTKATIELGIKKYIEHMIQFIKKTPQLHYFKALTPVKFRYLKYDVQKSVDETLHYKIVVEASYKQTSFKGIDKPGHHIHKYYAYTFKRSPLIASDGSIQYTDIKRYARINVAKKMQFAIEEKPLSKNEALALAEQKLASRK